MIGLVSFATLFAASALAAPAVVELEARQNASCPALPAGYKAPAVTKLPDPFTFANGDRVTTQADWACRQAEISQLFQTNELGALPVVDKVTATLSGTSLSITSTANGKTMSFSVSIRAPTTGTKPYPAIIAYGAPSIPIPAGVATITFNNDEMGAQINSGSRGQGKFYDLYGSSATAGAMMAWSWGVSRIMDALELTPAANIDPTRIGVTGCSRNGKGAFVAGAFEPRIALTIPQESGSGGAACWRISDSEHNKGANIQTASEIVGENCWFASSFNAFSTSTQNLPVDHHELAALVAPRGLFVIENDIDWLGPVSTNGCMKVGRVIYKAVGAPDAMGFSQASAHSHCQFPSSQQTDLTAFINKYLLGQSASTANIEKGTVTVAAADWMDWTAPTISS